MQRPLFRLRRRLRYIARSAFGYVRRLAFPVEATVDVVRFRGHRYVVWINEYPGQRLKLLGRYQNADIEILEKYTRPGDVCFDIGANVGLFSIALARAAGNTGRVFSFEPFEHNCCMVKINAVMNGVDTVEIVRAAVSDVHGISMRAVLDAGSTNYAYFLSEPNYDLTQPSSGMVSSVKLDEFVFERGISAVGVMKVDVEGQEANVLRGGLRLLQSAGRPRLILVELSESQLSRFGATVNDVISLLDESGYRLVSSPHGEREPENALGGRVTGNYAWASVVSDCN